MKTKSFLTTAIFGSIFGALAAAGTYYYIGSKSSLNQQISEKATITEKNNYHFAKNHGLVQGTDFTAAAELATPGVVHIKTFSNNTGQQGVDPFDDLFRDFFGERRQKPRIDQGPKALGSGSGVILTADGYIATNNHVIKGADKIEIVLNDKRKFEAELIGTDPTTDLALLKVEGEKLPFLHYGKSDDLKIGEWILAVGNPFDLNSTVTAGIVSAKARNINILRGKENLAVESFIQTDAAVNPGNSGGALVNLKGELVGINTAIASPTGAFAGYSFAVPSSIVQKVMDDLLQFGEVQRALLGVAISDVTDDLAKEKGLNNVKGVYISGVQEGSAAADADVQEGDVIIKINNTRVNSSSELQEKVAQYRPGDEVRVTLLRDNKEKIINVKLKNKLGTTAVVRKGEKAVAQVFGAKLQEISDSDKKKLHLKHGVKILDVGKGEFKNSDIKEGFVITHVNRQPVKTPEEVAYILQGTTEPSVLKGKYDSGSTAFYMVKP